VNLIQALILGLVQGLTEFIPISSSGHLVLARWLFGWEPDPGLLLPFDAVVHLGTLAAILGVFWRDFVTLAAAWVQSVRRRSLAVPYSKPAWALIIGTIPAALLGFFAADLVESLFMAPAWAAGFLLVTALLLYAGERLSARVRSVDDIGAHHALWPRSATGLALAPGLSRSGATITAGRFLGLERAEAARFSFLLAAPAIAGAGALQLLKLAGAGSLLAHAGILVAGFVTSLVSGYLVIRFLLSYLRRHSLLPFAAYCAAVGLLGLIAIIAR